jgi:peptidyl-prolyl cis-trans isomerase D
MMKFLRSQSQTVLVVVLGVIGLGFLFYGNAGNLLTAAGGRANSDFGRIDGEDLSVAQLYDAIRTTRDSLMLQGEAQQLMQPGASKQVAQEAWRQLLLLHEADRLHISISDRELVDSIKRSPVFQKNGVFSPEQFKSRMALYQTVLHVPTDGGVDAAASTEATFEKILRDQLRRNAVSSALFGNIHSSAHDITAQYAKYYGPTAVSVVTFDPKTFAGTVKVAPADIEKEYKDHPTNAAYRTKEKRKVDYVLYLLSPEEMKLPEDRKMKAKNALGEKATKFALAFVPDPSAAAGNTFTPPDFQTEAAKEGLAPMTTDFFAADETPNHLPPSPSFNNAAFALSHDNTISKVIELDNGVAVLHLSEIQPSQLRPLEEVRADIEKTLQQSKSAQQAQVGASIMSQALKSAVAKGTDFKTAAAGLKLSVESIPTFVPMKTRGGEPRLQAIAEATLSLKPGDVSGVVPVESNKAYLVIHLDSRAQPDPAGLADFETRYRQSQDEQLRSLVYTDWANWKSKQPGTHPPPDLESYGSVE